jgi:hypothetical protein
LRNELAAALIVVADDGLAVTVLVVPDPDEDMLPSFLMTVTGIDRGAEAH